MKLIAIEGPDKVGKQTQTKLLVEALGRTHRERVPGVAVQRKVTSVEIPFRDGTTHTKIYAMLKDGSALEYPHAFQTFQAANRMLFQAGQKVLLARHYDVLILDRWNVSSWVYGRASGLSEAFLAYVLDQVVEADHVFVLDGGAMGEPTDSYEADKGFMSTVRSEYKRWVQENPDVAIPIDANRPRAEVHKDILEHCLRWI